MLDGMRLKISQGNSKLGRMPNLSLPPIVTCRDNAPCIKDCYAKRFYLMWPNVRNAWDSNLEFYKENPDGFFRELCIYFATEKPKRFRLFVGGDFPDFEFYERFLDIADTYRDISILCFTKRYEFVDAMEVPPSNMKVILSIWPGLEIPELAYYLPTAWLSTDDRLPKFLGSDPYVVCPGRCDDCHHKCWTAQLPIVFQKH